MRKLFLASMLGVSATVVGAYGASTFSYIQQTEQQRILTEFERDGFVIAGRVEEGLEDNALNDALTALVTNYATSNNTRVVVIDQSGKSVITSHPEELALGEDFTNRPEIAAALTGNVATGERWSDTLQDQLVYVAVPVISGSTIYGAVRLSFSHDEIDAAVAAGTLFLWWIAAGSIALSVILSWYISGRVIRPLKLIEAQAEIMGAGDFTGRLVENKGAKEIRTLVHAFNGMAEKVESLMRQQRTFASDASHQLRTPLTALLLRLERARELVRTNPVGAEERLGAAEEEVQRLNSIVEGLLVIARADGGRVETGLVELSILARDRIEGWEPLCEEKGVKITLETPGAMVCSAILTAPEQVLDNYIDNALSHAPANSTITVRLSTDGDKVVAEVLDEGPGLSPEDCERAFDRFWRADSTREGNGLGLAIVKHLVESSGGSVSLSPRLDDAGATRGLIARATFPRG